jgi:F-box/leucine-rich repeat protein 2/20
MHRPRLPNRGTAWDTAEIKLPVGAKSRRRRLLNRITRFASSPTLTKAEQLPALDDKQSVSCVSLASESVADGSYKESQETGSGFFAAMHSSLEVFVDCDDGNETSEKKKKQETKWDNLPDEIKMGVLSWINPRELVKCSSVSGCGCLRAGKIQVD